MFLNRAAATTPNKISCNDIWKTWRSAALGVAILGEMQSVKGAVTNLIFYTLQSDKHAPTELQECIRCVFTALISQKTFFTSVAPFNKNR